MAHKDGAMYYEFTADEIFVIAYDNFVLGGLAAEVNDGHRRSFPREEVAEARKVFVQQVVDWRSKHTHARMPGIAVQLGNLPARNQKRKPS